MITDDDVLAALGTVRDPELDEPLTELGFVSSVRVRGSQVVVKLRLPTYFCAPNFSYLMAASAKAAVASLLGVEEVEVLLEDHFSAAEINSAVAGTQTLSEAFGPDSGDGLEALSTLFARKAFLARQGRLLERLLAHGAGHAELEAMTVAELPCGQDTDKYLSRRRELGLSCDRSDTAFCLPNGAPIPDGGLERQLRYARMVRLSVEANAGFCRSVLKTRYGIEDPEEVSS